MHRSPFCPVSLPPNFSRDGKETRSNTARTPFHVRSNGIWVEIFAVVVSGRWVVFSWDYFELSTASSAWNQLRAFKIKRLYCPSEPWWNTSAYQSIKRSGMTISQLWLTSLFLIHLTHIVTVLTWDLLVIIGELYSRKTVVSRGEYLLTALWPPPSPKLMLLRRSIFAAIKTLRGCP